MTKPSPQLALLLDVVLAVLALPVLLLSLAVFGGLPGGVELSLLVLGLTAAVVVRHRRRRARPRDAAAVPQ